jgi:hypothetical protein
MTNSTTLFDASGQGVAKELDTLHSPVKLGLRFSRNALIPSC